MEETKVKEHLKRNKHRYGYAILGGTVLILLLKKASTTTQIINTIAPVFNNVNATELGGHLRKIVYAVEPDRYFPSVTEAADFAGVSVSTMSRHLNGHTDKIYGVHFKIVGIAN